MAKLDKLKKLCDPLILRIILIVWGLITLAFAAFAHFDSGWSKQKKWLDGDIHFYNVCSNWEDRRKGADPDTSIPEADKYQPGPCPHLSMEWYFIAAIVFSLLGSIFSALLVYCNRKDSKIFNLVDCVLHGVIALLLIIGVIVFIVSANQAQDIAIYFSSLGPDHELDKDTLSKIGMRYEVKLFAAALAVVLIILHLILFVMTLIPIIRKLIDKKKVNAVASQETPPTRASQQGKAGKPEPPPTRASQQGKAGKPEPPPTRASQQGKAANPEPPPPPGKSDGKSPRGSKKST